MSEPSVIYAGASLKFTRAEDGTYTSADGYTLLYELFNTEQLYTIAEDTVDAVAWLVEVPSSVTETYDPGHYRWMCFAVKTGEKWLLASGSLDIELVGAQRDGRSHARKMLDALEAMLQGKATSDQVSLSIAGRSISRMSPNELEEWRDKYRSEVRAEAQAEAVADGKESSSVVRVGF